jgi:tetratricopeptide (TPR) repeat protein
MLRLLDRAPAAATPIRAKALCFAGTASLYSRRIEEGRRLLESGLAAFRELGDGGGVAKALGWLGHVHRDMGDYVGARACFEEGLRIARQIGDPLEIAGQLGLQGMMAVAEGDYRAARAHFEESVCFYDKIEERETGTWAVNNLGRTLTILGEAVKARPLLEECLAAGRRTGSRFLTAGGLLGLGRITFHLGDLPRARCCIHEALCLFREMAWDTNTMESLNLLAAIARVEEDPERARALYEESLTVERRAPGAKSPVHALVQRGDALIGLGDLCLEAGDAAIACSYYQATLQLETKVPNPVVVAGCLEGLAGVARAKGCPERAAKLLGAASGLREASGAVILPYRRAEHEHLLESVKADLGDAWFAAAWAEGQAMSPEEAVTVALQDHTDA